MTHITQDRIERTLAVIIDAAVTGKRCPPNKQADGYVEAGAISRLASTGYIRVEYSSVNFRRVYLLKGEHAGKSTGPDPKGNPVYAIRDKDGLKRIAGVTNEARRQQRGVPGLPQYNFMKEDIA